MKKLISFLKTTLTREVKTSVGYTIFQILLIITLLFGTVQISKEYFDYRIQTEQVQQLDSLKIRIYENYIFENNKE